MRLRRSAPWRSHCDNHTLGKRKGSSDMELVLL
jgi:hypothetical protein